MDQREQSSRVSRTWPGYICIIVSFCSGARILTEEEMCVEHFLMNAKTSFPAETFSLATSDLHVAKFRSKLRQVQNEIN